MIVVLHRCTSRVNFIPFKKPAVGPVSRIEREAYTELTCGIKNLRFSPCISWIISQVDHLDNLVENADESDFMRNTIFPGAPRLQQGWTVVLYFTRKV